MHLITALAAGVRGAEDGTAEIYSRGTSTRATYYYDFEGNDSDSSGADVDLDSNGGASVYVNEYVTVTVKNSSGVTVRTFTDGVQANAVEVISDSFTGTDYDSAASGASKPISLGAILDKWNNSAGTTSSNGLDWKVAINGTDTNLSSAIGAIAGLFFNVKDPAYGALGDGSADDTSAIEAALTAATVNGGTVYFPPGTYRTTTDIDVPSDVMMLGAGPDASVLQLDSAANADQFSFATTSIGLQRVASLGFTCNQANSGSFMALGANARLLIENCHFNAANMTGEAIDGYTASPEYIQISNCVFEGDASSIGYARLDMARNAIIESNRFIISGTGALDVVRLDQGVVANNHFYSGSALNASSNIINADDSSLGVTVVGNTAPLSGAAGAFLTVNDLTASGGSVVETGNFIISGITTWRDTLVPSDITAVADYEWVQGSRIGRNISSIGGATTATVTLSSDKAEVTYILVTGNSNFQLDGTLAAPNSYLTVVAHNNSGGPSGSLTWGSMFVPASASFLFSADARMRIFRFVSAICELNDDTAELRWVEISDTGELSVAP